MSGPTWNQPESAPPDEASRRRPLVDSGLFWLLVFGIMATGGYLAVSPKYEQRREGIETKFEGRRQAWLNRIDGEIESSDDSTSGNGQTWLLVVVSLSVVLVLGGGSWLLLRSSSNRPETSTEGDRPDEYPSRDRLGQNP